MRRRSKCKDVVCLESLWDEQIEYRLSVQPILELAGKLKDIRVIHLTCNTVPELDHNIGLLKRRPSFKILYLAFHGRPGYVQLPTAELSLEDLARMLGKRVRGWIIHFGTCGTINVPDGRLQAFIRQTDAAMVLGYGKSVDWMDAASTELLLLDWLQEYHNLGSFWSGFRARHRDLVRITDLRAIAAR